MAGLAQFVSNLKLTDVVVQSDGETPIKAMVLALCKVLREKHGVKAVARTPAKFSHQSQGAVEATIRHGRSQFKTMRSALEKDTGITINT